MALGSWKVPVAALRSRFLPLEETRRVTPVHAEGRDATAVRLLLYLGGPFGGGKAGGGGGVSSALWCEEVSSSGSTVWHACSFRWKRWPQ